MGYIEKHKAFYQQVLNLLEHHLGPSTEIVLHDLKSPYDRTIVDIRNGHITGRKVGDSITSLGLEVMRGTIDNGDYYNYITYIKPSNTLRSSTMHIHDENGDVVGAICVNTDITDTIKVEEFLKRYNGYTEKQGNQAVPTEIMADNIQDLLEQLLSDAAAATGKEVELMSREDKLKFLLYLEKKGTFLISKSGDRVCDYLHISKFTLYKYLETVREELGKGAPDNPPE